jgi:hypothetical protein
MYLCPYYSSRLSPPKNSLVSTRISEKAVNLQNVIRMLWEQHIIWTRLTILNIIKDLPEVNLVTNRLLRNPIDFKEVLKPVYGDEVASQFSDLLKSHLVIAAQLVKAAKAGGSRC